MWRAPICRARRLTWRAAGREEGHAGEAPAGTGLDRAADAWARTPGAAMLLPVGRSFDVLDVAEQAGRRALVRIERIGPPLGPVTVTPTGRAQFFVAPGAAAELPELLYRMGWDDAGLDLRALGPGTHITAPPSDLGGLGPVRWLRPPVLDAAAAPPQARLLLGTLAYVPPPPIAPRSAHRSPPPSSTETADGRRAP
ncbi:hypothetical protein SBADM41S_07363 [Streptomyces badius]